MLVYLLYKFWKLLIFSFFERKNLKRVVRYYVWNFLKEFMKNSINNVFNVFEFCYFV